MMKICIFSNKTTGSALIIALILVATMSLFGAVLYQYAHNDFKFTSQDQDSAKAYYIAKSGANAYITQLTAMFSDNDYTFSAILSFINASKKAKGTISGTDFFITVDDSAITASPEIGESEYIIVSSTATYGPATRTVKAKLPILRGAAGYSSGIMTKAALNFDKSSQNMYVDSHLLSASSIHPPDDNHFNSGRSILENQNFPYNPISLASYTSYFTSAPAPSSLTVANKSTVTISANSQYVATGGTKSYGIKVETGGKLIFDTSKSDALYVMVDKLYNSGTMEITGSNPLYLIITTSYEGQAKSKINVIPDAGLTGAPQILQNKVDKFNIYMAKNSFFNAQSGEEFIGSVYAVGGSVEIISGNNSISGMVIADNFDGANNSTFLEVLPSKDKNVDANIGRIASPIWRE